MTEARPHVLVFPEGLDPAATHHLVRAELTPRRPRRLHGHAFHELLWVQNGTVRHHLPDRREDLAEGDLIFIRPGDTHGLQGRGEAAMVVSLSIRDSAIATLGARHLALAGMGFWSDGPVPPRHHLDMRRMAEVNHAALRLERGPRDALTLEAFLLPLLADLAQAPADIPPEAPAWLRHACAAAQDPEVFRQGAAGLVRVAGRAHPHVARTMRRHMGQTPSDYVNARRMAHAATRLLGSEDSLAEIAADCGVPNLSHFHKLFLAAHGQTPQRFRRARRQQLIQP